MPVSTKTVNAVIAYRDELEAKDSDIMFPGGKSKDPVNPWVKKIKRYYEKHGFPNVQTHNFRSTKATNFYKKSLDLIGLRDMLGHSDVKMSENYVKTKKQDVIKKMEAMLPDNTKD